MRKLYILLLIGAVLTACQESFEDRCEREAKDFTTKKCPAQINLNTRIDSMTFDKRTLTVSYYYTMSGSADNAMAIKKMPMEARWAYIAKAWNYYASGECPKLLKWSQAESIPALKLKSE